ncbi:MAG: AzlC family ABC transporter permease [Actinomycetota bacterium]
MERSTAARLAPILPVAVAIFVFGTIYGASQAGLTPPVRTIASSALVFSGAAQFTAAGLLAAGAGAGVVLGTVAVLNLRHLLLGAVLRQRLEATPARRAALALCLIDETAGLALAERREPLRIYVLAGVASYLAWVGGTAVGVLGGQVVGDPLLAEAIFPVLFVGLAASAIRGRADAARAVGAALATIAVVALLPGLGSLAPIVVAVALASVGRRA